MFPFRDQGGFSGSYSLFGDDPLNLPGENSHSAVAEGGLGLRLGEPERLATTQGLPSMFQRDPYGAGAAPLDHWNPQGVSLPSGSNPMAPYGNSYPSYEDPLATPGTPGLGSPWGAWSDPAQGEASLVGVDPYQQALSADGAASAVHGAPERQTHRRKPKMYQLGPLDDPDLEKKRLRAIKQHRKRQKAEQHERNLNINLNLITQQVTSLRLEREKCLHVVSGLEEELERASGRPAPLQDQQGHFADDVWQP